MRHGILDEDTYNFGVNPLSMPMDALNLPKLDVQNGANSTPLSLHSRSIHLVMPDSCPNVYPELPSTFNVFSFETCADTSWCESRAILIRDFEDRKGRGGDSSELDGNGHIPIAFHCTNPIQTSNVVIPIEKEQSAHLFQTCIDLSLASGLS